jgi:hypothetical protein
MRSLCQSKGSGAKKNFSCIIEAGVLAGLSAVRYNRLRLLIHTGISRRQLAFEGMNQQ